MVDCFTARTDCFLAREDGVRGVGYSCSVGQLRAVGIRPYYQGVGPDTIRKDHRAVNLGGGVQHPRSDCEAYP